MSNVRVQESYKNVNCNNRKQVKMSLGLEACLRHESLLGLVESTHLNSSNLYARDKL